MTALGRTRNITCAACGHAIKHVAGRRPRFCSTRCRNQENGRRRVRKALLGRDTGAAAKRTKNIKQTNELQRGKKQSSTGIVGPPDVINIEVFGSRRWQQAISSGGVAIEVGRLRQRALVDNDGWRDCVS